MKPPLPSRPMVFCVWLCPQYLGRGPRLLKSLSRIGHPVRPKPSMPGMSE